jgi:hypothetical protein
MSATLVDLSLFVMSAWTAAMDDLLGIATRPFVLADSYHLLPFEALGMFVHAGLVEKAAASFGAVLLGISLAQMPKNVGMPALQSTTLLLLIDAVKQFAVFTHDVCGSPRTTDSYHTSRIGFGVLLVQIPVGCVVWSERIPESLKRALLLRGHHVIERYCYLSAAVMLRLNAISRDEQGYKFGPIAGSLVAAVCALFALTPAGLREHLFTAAAFLRDQLQRIAKLMCARCSVVVDPCCCPSSVLR